MKIKITKIICGFLALCMIATTFPTEHLVSAKDPTLLFEDDFLNTTLSGWEDNTIGAVSDGVYALGQDAFNVVSKVGDRADSIISADISINIGKDSNGARQGGVASLVLRANSDGTKGYEFSLGVSKSGSGYLRLYRRGVGEDGMILLQKSEEIPGVEKIQRNTSYHLTMAVFGQRIICMINGAVFADMEDELYASGGVGIKTNGARGTYDNVKVQSVPEQKVEQISIVKGSYDEKVSLTGKVYVEIDVKYNSVYGTARLNQDDEGVTLSGMDGKSGKKTITVSYGGKNATFPIEVTEKFTPTVLHDESFSKELSGYTDGTYTNTDYGYTYQFKVQNGKGVVNACNTKGADLPMSVDLTVPEEKSSVWRQYSVAADVAVSGDSTTVTKRLGQAAIIVAKRTADRASYTYRVNSAGTISIYRGSEMLYTNTTAALGLDFSVGTKIALKADVYEDHAEFYYNNKLVTILTEINEQTITPHAGISSINGSTWFDNWTVKELETKGAHAVKSFEIVSTVTQDQISHVKSRVLSLGDLLLKVSYIDGTTGLVAVKKQMLSEYSQQSPKAQTITITYAGQKRTFQYTYVPYLFYDDFTSGHSSLWNISVDSLSSYSVENSRLGVKYQDGGTKASAVTGIVAGGDEWSNYAVSADVFFDARAKISGRVRTAGLVARRSGNYYYEFRLEYSGSRMKATLYRFGEDGTTQLKAFGTSQLRDCVGETKALGLGVEYNIKLEVRSNTIKCYLDGVALPVFVDESEFALSSGTAGIKCANNTATYDNFIVQEKSAQAITALRLSGTKENTVELYEGFDIDLPMYSLEVVDEDGSYDTVSLTSEMISEFDNTALGKQQITLKYQGFSYPATVVISERPEELKKFAGEVEKESDIAKLKDMYDSFSPYELSKIDEKVLEKYEELLETDERTKDKNLKGLDLLWADALNEVSDETWNDSIEGNSGKWLNLNGTFYQAQRPYNLVVNGWRSPDVYGELYSISADMTMLSQDMYMGMALNISEVGYYHVRVSNKDRNEENEVVYKVQLLKKTNNGHTVLTSEYLSVYDINLDLGVKFHMSLTLKDGILSVFVNGTQVVVYDDSTNNNQYTSGECGLRISEGDGIYDNIRVYGKALKRPEEETASIEPTYYKDDFEDETKGRSPSHWQENYVASSVVDNWKVYDKDGSKVYGTDVVSGLTETWLHVFEKEPAFSTKFMVATVSKDGKVGFITRRSPDTAFVNIGYDFSESKWYIASQESEAGGCEMFWADKTFELKKGEWYTARIESNGKTVTLYINDKEVLTSESVRRTGFGRIGFYTNHASMYVDDVDCTFKYGDIPQDGLVSYVVEPNKFSSYMEIESTDDGKTLVGVGTTRKYSTDSGLTWSDITSDTSWAELKIGSYPTILELHDGTYIQVLQTEEFSVQKSSDLKNWETIGQVVPDEELLSDTGNEWGVLHINTAAEFNIGNGQYRIFCPIGFRKYDQYGSTSGHFTRVYYSDDGGVTWEVSETDTKELLPGYEESDSSTWCESKIIQCSDGTLRMYYSRNYLGCMQYTESKDNGQTWEGLYQIPEMQNAMTSFAIMEDPTEKGTYYMVWINGSAKYLGSMLPRVRPCLLKSTDGKNWEFLMNCEYMTEFNSTTNGESLYQILDPSLYITEDYVYVTFGRSEREFSKDNANSHQEQRCYYLRVEKAKLEAREWNASTIANMNYPKTIEFETLPQTKFGKGDLFNTFGGTIKITSLNGKVTTEELSKSCSVYMEPNMTKLGTVTIPVYYTNGYELNYDITIVPNYRVTWKISQGGKVDPKSTRVMEGSDLEVKLVPDAGFTIDYVIVNEETVSTVNRILKIKNVTEDLKIEVVFRAITWLDYLIWIGGGIVLCGGIGAGTYILIRRKKRKTAGNEPTTE